MELADIKDFLLAPSLSEPQVIKMIKEMSAGFTTNRDMIGEYVMSEERVSAYTSFYLPTNMPKLSFILSQVSSEVIEDLKEANFIDMGCGPGTYSLALLESIPDFKGELHLVDSSTVMLKQAKKLIDGIYPEFENAHYHQSIPDNFEGPTVLFFGHSMNEIGVSDSLRLIRKLDPDYLFILEPGTKEVFADVLKVRRKLRSQEYNALYPCASMGDCPMERRPDDWCHGVINMVHSPELERLSQLVSLDRRAMPFIGHLYSKKHYQPSKKARLIQIIDETKFSFEVSVCHEVKDVLTYSRIELLKKGMNKKGAKEFKKANRGIGIEYQEVKVLPGGKVRATLK